MKAVIGVVAGVGPFAGIDLLKKITLQTRASTDQAHLPVLSLSNPSEIADRTDFLLGHTGQNPAQAIARQLITLSQMGATVAGIPCNTAHAPAIFDVIQAETDAQPIEIVHMLREVGLHLQLAFSDVTKVGVLSTDGSRQSGVYSDLLTSIGYKVECSTDDEQSRWVSPAIYDQKFGIKSTGLVSAQAKDSVLQAAQGLQKRGAEAFILGCTELPLAFSEPWLNGVPLIDPSLILARALIRKVGADCMPLV